MAGLGLHGSVWVSVDGSLAFFLLSIAVRSNLATMTLALAKDSRAWRLEHCYDMEYFREEEKVTGRGDYKQGRENFVLGF